MALINPYQKFCDAMRSAVFTQSFFVKQRAKFCNHCKRDLDRRTCEVDHVTPFTEVLAGFMGPKPWDKEIQNVIYVRDARGAFALSWVEHREFLTAWLSYHKRNAVLQALCRRCHDKKDRSA